MKRIYNSNNIFLKEAVQDLNKIVFNSGKKYGLNDYRLVDFYYFVERSGRAGSGNASIPFSGCIIPFLNKDLIKTTFSLSKDEHISGMLHNYIMKKNVPDILSIPFDVDLISLDSKLNKTPYNEDIFWHSNTAKKIMEEILSGDHYLWETLLNKTEIIRLWYTHLQKQCNQGEFLWRVAGFYYWYENFKPYLKK